jgi:hypothetical protein
MKTDEPTCTADPGKCAAGAVELRDGTLALVFASGSGYLVDVKNDTVSQLSGSFVDWYVDRKRNQIILNDRGHCFTAIKGDGSIAWRSEVLSRGGFAEVTLGADVIAGKACDPCIPPQNWESFTLDLVSGRQVGGKFKSAA